jgi:hypothetical protein
MGTLTSDAALGADRASEDRLVKDGHLSVVLGQVLDARRPARTACCSPAPDVFGLLELLCDLPCSVSCFATSRAS